MNVQGLAGNFASFLTKHSGELRMVGAALETIVAHLPIDQQDKERIMGVTENLQTAAHNIAQGAEVLAGQEIDVVVSKTDVENAVAAYLAEHPELFTRAPAHAEG